MKTIGITGGVGSGKSEILKYIKDKYNCRVILSDKLAYELESPGHSCYDEIVSLIGNDIVGDDGYIIKAKMATKIFENPDLLKKVNGILHPAVKIEILNAIEYERNRNQIDFFFLEAALLIEEGYDKILDELWYIRVPENIRRNRLKESRGYSDEKIDSIFEAQLKDEVFLRYCKVVIDNGNCLEDTYKQIDNALAN